LQHADALDASQEVLSRVHQSIESWDPDKSKGTFRGWLYRVTANTSINVLKKLARHPRATGDSDIGVLIGQLPASVDEDSSLFRAEYRRELFRFVANAVRGEFSETSWDAFWKTTVDGKDAKCAAAELGLSVGAVYTAKCRVLSRIRQMAQRLLAEDAQ
jgi:RNA polymerase sigma-70 factor (ECF subfamily)